MQTVTATEFIRTLSGTKKACLFKCVDEDDHEYEIVVKFREAVAGNTMGLVAEVICNRLASALDLSVPEGFIVEVPPGMGDFILQREYATVANASAGLNFGSLMAGQGAAFPNSFFNPTTAPSWACEVFSFDFLVQNFDRQTTNPNLLFNGKNYFMIDHEQAFAGVSFPSSNTTTPWAVDPFYKHLFYKSLDLATDWSSFYSKLSKISHRQIEAWFSQLPEDWLARKADVGRLKNYLLTVGSLLKEVDETMKSMISS